MGSLERFSKRICCHDPQSGDGPPETMSSWSPNLHYGDFDTSNRAGWPEST
jgi:hypothetical protein